MSKSFELFFYESGDEYKLSLTEVYEAVGLGDDVNCPAVLKGTELIVDLRPALSLGTQYCAATCKQKQWVTEGFPGEAPGCSCHQRG